MSVCETLWQGQIPVIRVWLRKYACVRNCTPNLLPFVRELRPRQSTSDNLLRFNQRSLGSADQKSPLQSKADKKAI